ncbi:MAG: S-methyl-5'-thioadenosine phosphorylase [Armatimonadota bacterium]
MTEKCDIGIFGGSGFYSLLTDVKEIDVETPFGRPSDKIAVAKIKDKTVAFLPRHGKGHNFLPHMINYRANIWAFKELGIKRIIAPAASGSLQKDIKPGEFVICDQFIDRTKNRKDTFYEGPPATHISAADPYCPALRDQASKTADTLGIPHHKKGTMVVIQGPRFSTRAESKWFAQMGWEVVNMTGYPEAILAREAEICYANISLITDYDVGLEGMPPVTAQEVLEIFKENNEKVKELLLKLIEDMPQEIECSCHKALAGARF